MADTAKVSGGALGAVVLGGISLLLWFILVPGLASLAGSDAAGNAMAQAFTAFALIALWMMLGLLLIVSWIAGNMPTWAAIVALILLPTSGIAAFDAMQLLTRPNLPPHLWPLIIPALVPPLVLAFAFWAVLPVLRAAVPAPIAAGVVWGSVLALIVALVPMSEIRHAVDEQESARLQKYNDDYESLPKDAGLAALAPFLDTRSDVQQNEVLARMRAVPQRQSEAEAMLDRGDFPFGVVDRLDLEPTPALCAKMRAFLRKRVEPLVSKAPGTQPYTLVAEDVVDAVAALQWLTGYDCPCDEEVTAWENMANGYKDTSFDVVRLRELHDKKELGRTLRESPQRFAQLTPKAHLKAWLKFADEDATREQALAGARALDHRTADAIEMLTDPYDTHAPWQVMMYLPELNLETTPRLCSVALAKIRVDVSKTYHPKPDEPSRSYDELLSRLGAGEPLTALIWLAGHGCDANADLADAEALVRLYRDSPGRAAMLADLAKVRSKP